jgi:hypothetical protein
VTVAAGIIYLDEKGFKGIWILCNHIWMQFS